MKGVAVKLEGDVIGTPLDAGQRMALQIYHDVVAQAGQANGTQVAVGMATAAVAVMVTQFGEVGAAGMLHLMLKAGGDSLRRIDAAKAAAAAAPGAQPKATGPVH